MRRPSLNAAFLVLAFALAWLTGCGPRWAIIAQAVPDPLVGATAFYIEPVHFDPPLVGQKLEAEYLADKSPDQQASWQADKAECSARYAGALMENSPHLKFAVQPAPGIFIIRPIVTFIEPGFYAAIVAAPTELHLRLQILSSDGTLVDEIAMPSLIGASLIYPASGTRIRLAGEDLGRVTADYLKKRTGEG